MNYHKLPLKTSLSDTYRSGRIHTLTFGEFLKRSRFAAGFSQRQLASLVGMNSSHLSRIESGQKNPPKLETIGRIAQVLNLNGQLYRGLFEAAGYLPPKPEHESVQTGPPGFHSVLRLSRSRSGSSLATDEVQLQGLARKALDQMKELLIREDLKPRQRGRLAREIISFLDFLQARMQSADSKPESSDDE